MREPKALRAFAEFATFWLCCCVYEFFWEPERSYDPRAYSEVKEKWEEDS